MNILLYVTTVIMILTALSYSRLEHFHGFFGVQAGFKQYMETTERKPLSMISDRWYHKVKLATHKSEGRGSANKASSRLPIFTILNSEDRTQNANFHSKVREILKKLMVQLYHDQKSFAALYQKNPQFLDAVLDQLEAAADQYFAQEDKKGVKAEILSNLTIEELGLRNIVYVMLKGTPQDMEPEKQKKKLRFDQPIAKKSVGKEEEADAAEESMDSHSEAGYVSLIDQVTADKKLKIRVYLASPDLLMAIYEDQKLVDEIVNERQQIYRALKNDSLKEHEGTETFKNRFALAGKAAQYGEILDFGVSKSNPNKKKK